MSEQKKSDGTYVVLQVVEGDTTFELVSAAVEAHRPEEALKKAVATHNLTGQFIVVASKSWRVFDAEPTTSIKVTAVE